MSQKFNREILRLALPSILANITVPLVGMVDVAVVGHMADATAIGGIAVGTMLFDLLYWNFGFLRAGTGGTTAQALGQKDYKHAAEILLQSLSLAALATLVIWLFQWLFVAGVLWCVPCSPQVASFAKNYFFIRIWATPATLALMAFRGWFIGMQNAAFAMVCDLVVNISNIILSMVLACYTPLGVMGVAWGTLLAQYLGLFVAIALAFVRYNRVLRLADLRECARWQKIRHLCVLNGNLFVRSLCFMVVYVGFTALSSQYGDAELATSALMMKLFMLFSYFVDGFAYAGEALTGRFVGEYQVHNSNALQNLRVVVKQLFVWTFCIGATFSLFYAFCGDFLLHLLTTDIAVLQVSSHYYVWLILMPVVSSLAFMWDGIYIGATAGATIRNAMIWAAVGFVTIYLTLFYFVGVQAVYVAYFVHLVVRTLFLTLKWRPTFRRIELKQ